MPDTAGRPRWSSGASTVTPSTRRLAPSALISGDCDRISTRVGRTSCLLRKRIGARPRDGRTPMLATVDCVSHRTAKVVHPGQSASVLIYEHVLRDARLIL